MYFYCFFRHRLIIEKARITPISLCNPRFLVTFIESIHNAVGK